MMLKQSALWNDVLPQPHRDFVIVPFQGFKHHTRDENCTSHEERQPGNVVPMQCFTEAIKIRISTDMSSRLYDFAA